MRVVAAIAITRGIASLVYRLLHATNLDQTAALFIGLPSLMSFAAAFLALRLHAGSVIGITLKGISCWWMRLAADLDGSLARALLGSMRGCWSNPDRARR